MNYEDRVDLEIIEDLLEMSDEDNPEFFADHLVRFSKFMDENKQNLIDAIQGCERGKVETIAHSMTGSSANFGAKYLAELCRSLEQNAKSMDSGEMKLKYGDICVEYDQFSAYIRRKGA